MSSTGIRVGAIKELEIKHLRRLQESNTNIGILDIYPQSKDHRCNALLTTECMVALDEYFEFRRRQHEKITGDYLLDIKKDDRLDRRFATASVGVENHDPEYNTFRSL
jgi:hypothetical protein